MGCFDSLSAGVDLCNFGLEKEKDPGYILQFEN